MPENEYHTIQYNPLRMVVLVDLNARVGNVPVMNVIGNHGVPGRNESGELCMERELIVGNTWFKKKDINK